MLEVESRQNDTTSHRLLVIALETVIPNHETHDESYALAGLDLRAICQISCD